MTFRFHGNVPCVSVDPYKAAVKLQDVLIFLNIIPQKPALMPFKRHLLEIRNDFLLLTWVQASRWSQPGSNVQPTKARARSKLRP